MGRLKNFPPDLFLLFFDLKKEKSSNDSSDEKRRHFVLQGEGKTLSNSIFRAKNHFCHLFSAIVYE